MSSYVLTTLALDQRERPPGLLADLEGQELTPSLWLVVDDGSSDGTFEHPRSAVGRGPRFVR